MIETLKQVPEPSQRGPSLARSKSAPLSFAESLTAEVSSIEQDTESCPQRLQHCHSKTMPDCICDHTLARNTKALGMRRCRNINGDEYQIKLTHRPKHHDTQQHETGDPLSSSLHTPAPPQPAALPHKHTIAGHVMGMRTKAISTEMHAVPGLATLRSTGAEGLLASQTRQATRTPKSSATIADLRTAHGHHLRSVTARLSTEPMSLENLHGREIKRNPSKASA